MFCVSGQTISDLKNLLKVHRSDINGKVVCVMIGTNDFLVGRPLLTCKSDLKSLVLVLKRLCREVFVLEILPLATHLVSSTVNCNIFKFNSYIQSFNGCVKVLPVRCFNTCDVVNVSLYNEFYIGSSKVDLIHPNEEGLCKRLEIILASFL
jgi:lysophospholipase L1-like esterase